MAFLYNSIRENLLQNNQTHSALVLDLLYASGWEQGHTLGVLGILDRAREMGIQVGEYVVRKGLRQLVSSGLLSTKKFILGRGRPVIYYRLGSMLSIAKILELPLHTSEYRDEINPDAFDSVSAYRASLHRGFLKRRPGRYSRQWLADRLGVSKKTTYNYEQRFDDIRVTLMNKMNKLWDFMIDLLPKKRSKFVNRWLMVEMTRPMTEEEIEHYYGEFDGDYRSIMNTNIKIRKKYPAIRPVAQRLKKLGYEIWDCSQGISYYEVQGFEDGIRSELEVRGEAFKEAERYNEWRKL